MAIFPPDIFDVDAPYAPVPEMVMVALPVELPSEKFTVSVVDVVDVVVGV